MLFHIQGFKKISTAGPVLDCLEKLYSLGVLDCKGQQELKLKDEILDKIVFCQVEREATDIESPWRRDRRHPQCSPGCVEAARSQVLIRSPGHTFSDTLGPRDLTAVKRLQTLFKTLSYSTQIDTILGPRDQRKKKKKET